MPFSHDPDDLVATVRGVAITYRSIRCHPEIDEPLARRNGDKRPIDDICRETERRLLRHRLQVELVLAAADLCPIHPTPEQLRVVSPELFEEKLFEKRVRARVRRAQAVQRVHAGENADAVYEELLRPLGLDRQSFLNELPYWQPGGPESILNGDPSAYVRAELMRSAIVNAAGAILRERHGLDDEARRAFWEEIIRATDTVVMPGFEKPDWRMLP
jgi:hypothetical protein